MGDAGEGSKVLQSLENGEDRRAGQQGCAVLGRDPEGFQPWGSCDRRCHGTRSWEYEELADPKTPAPEVLIRAQTWFLPSKALQHSCPPTAGKRVLCL